MQEKENMNNEKQIQAKWERIDNENIGQALDMLKKHNKDVKDFLADCVASVCGVSTDDMMSNSNVLHIAHARWLYWYAYRYMTNETFDKISQQTKTETKKFVGRAIQHGATKMSMMIDGEPLWTKRWNTIKRIIKLRDKEDKKLDNNIIIQVPKDIKDKINIIIKEK